MKTKFLFSMALLFFCVFAGCGRKTIEFKPGQARFTNGSGGKLSAEIIWLKKKSDSFDLLLSVQNSYPHGVSFNMSSAKMSFGGFEGSLLKNNFRETHRTYVSGTGGSAVVRSGQIETEAGLKAGAREQAIMTFEFERDIPSNGTGVIEVSPIYGVRPNSEPLVLEPLKIEISVN